MDVVGAVWEEGGRGRGLQAGVREVDVQVEGRRGRHVGRRSEEREHFLVDVDAQGADGEDVAPEVELAVAERGDEERWVDVGLRDEVAEVGCHDAWFVVLGV